MSLTFPARSVTLVLLFALAGCSADGVYGPQKFFPGDNRHSWNDCEKFSAGTPVAQVCAGYTYPPGGLNLTPQSYVISFFIASEEHVLLAVFDEAGAGVKVLVDQDVPAVSPGQNWPTVVWDFTDDAGRRVPGGDYRAYFRAGDYVSSSDVEVP